MPSNYFGGAPNAFAGGMEFSAAQRRRRLGDNALAALIDQYGPAAADPAALAQLTTLQQSRDLHPFDVAAAQRQQGAADALVAKRGALAGDPAAMAADEALQERDRTLAQRTGLNVANYLQATRAKGGDIGAAYDRVVKILPQFGIPAELLGPIREQVVGDPTGAALDSFISMFRGERRAIGQPVPVYDKDGRPRLLQNYTDGSSAIVDGVTPASTVLAEGRLNQGAERLGLGWSNLQWDRVKEYLPARQAGVQTFTQPDGRVVAEIVPGSPAEQEFSTKLREMDAGDRKLIQSFGLVSDHADVVQRNAERALSFFNGADAGVLLQTLRSGARRLPGTDAYNAWDALETIRNNVAVDELQRMRQSSPSGGAMGNVSDRDISLISGALGRLEVERDPARLTEDIRNLVSTYTKIMRFAKQDAEDAEYRMKLRQQVASAPAPVAAPGSVPGGGFSPDVQAALDKYR